MITRVGSGGPTTFPSRTAGAIACKITPPSSGRGLESFALVTGDPAV
jgi:hypothetical protein